MLPDPDGNVADDNVGIDVARRMLSALVQPGDWDPISQCQQNGIEVCYTSFKINPHVGKPAGGTGLEDVQRVGPKTKLSC